MERPTLAKHPTRRDNGLRPKQLPPLAPDRFRAVMRSFPTGVTVVTARKAGERAVGFTANAIASVSLQPPLVLVCIANQLYTLSVIHETGLFAINFLEHRQENIARWFATQFADPSAPSGIPSKFLDVAHASTGLDLPIIEGVLAYAECVVEAEIPAGDHHVVIGRVVGGNANEGKPLVYYQSQYLVGVASGAAKS